MGSRPMKRTALGRLSSGRLRKQANHPSKARTRVNRIAAIGKNPIY